MLHNDNNSNNEQQTIIIMIIGISVEGGQLGGGFEWNAEDGNVRYG